MSAFSGKIEEFPGIAVDNFQCNARIYFLSHCHSDHMNGLNSFKKIDGAGSPLYIYVSPVSYAIVKNLHPEIAANLKIINLEYPLTIAIDSGNLNVTALPAGHCPGSLMFLFEKIDCIVLYTGDYRLTLRDLKKLKGLQNADGKTKRVDKIYMDSTFFLKEYKTFPGREWSVETICKLTEEWIRKGPDFIVNLHTSANYGYEYLFIVLHKRTKMPVKVDKKLKQIYNFIPEMDGVCTDLDTTQIQSFREKQHGNKTRTIRISAWKFNNRTGNDFIHQENQIFSVCYATHASYTESIDLINFFKPKTIVPFSTPPGQSNRIIKNIQEILNEFQNKTVEKNDFFQINQEDSLLINNMDDPFNSPELSRKNISN